MVYSILVDSFFDARILYLVQQYYKGHNIIRNAILEPHFCKKYTIGSKKNIINNFSTRKYTIVYTRRIRKK